MSTQELSCPQSHSKNNTIIPILSAINIHGVGKCPSMVMSIAKMQITQNI